MSNVSPFLHEINNMSQHFLPAETNTNLQIPSSITNPQRLYRESTNTIYAHQHYHPSHRHHNKLSYTWSKSILSTIYKITVCQIIDCAPCIEGLWAYFAFILYINHHFLLRIDKHKLLLKILELILIILFIMLVISFIYIILKSSANFIHYIVIIVILFVEIYWFLFKLRNGDYYNNLQSCSMWDENKQGIII